MGTGDRKQDDKTQLAIRRAQALIRRYGECLLVIQEYIEGARGDGDFVVELRFKARYALEGDMLVVVKAEGEQGERIAFHSAGTLPEAVQGVANRLMNGDLKWKEDKPYDDR